MKDGKNSFEHDLGLAHAKIAKERLGHLYHLKPTLEYIQKNPEVWVQIMNDYVQMVDKVMHLNDDDKQVVIEAETLKGGDKFSAAKTQTVTLLQMFEGKEDEITRLMGTILDPGSDNFKEAWKVMETTMTGGWFMKIDGLKPFDNDPRSDRVKWGHVRGSSDPRIDAEFVAAHLSESIMTLALTGTGNDELIKQKDWWLPILSTGILLGMAKEDPVALEHGAYWMKPRPNGLGWENDESLGAYKTAVKNHIYTTTVLGQGEPEGWEQL